MWARCTAKGQARERMRFHPVSPKVRKSMNDGMIVKEASTFKYYLHMNSTSFDDTWCFCTDRSQEISAVIYRPFQLKLFRWLFRVFVWSCLKTTPSMFILVINYICVLKMGWSELLRAIVSHGGPYGAERRRTTRVLDLRQKPSAQNFYLFPEYPCNPCNPCTRKVTHPINGVRCLQNKLETDLRLVCAGEINASSA